MTDRSRNAVIGLFVLGGLIALATLVVLFGESRGLFDEGYIIEVHFTVEDMPAIRQGTDVTMSGIWVGTVAEVALVDPVNPTDGVEAKLEIDNQFSVPQGSRVVVVTPLMGTTSVNIVPPKITNGPPEPLARDGSAEPLRGSTTDPLETVIDPEVIITFERAAEQIGELAKALVPAADAIKDILEQRTIAEVEAAELQDRELAANLYTAAERLHNVLEHIETVLGDPNVQSNIKVSLDNFQQASEDVKLAAADIREVSEQSKSVVAGADQFIHEGRTLVADLQQTSTVTRQHIDVVGRKLSGNLDQLSRVLDYGIDVGEDLAEGDGTLGLLLRDPKFYDELILTVQRLGTSAAELEILIRQIQKKGILGL